MDEILQVNGLKTSFLNSNGETQAVRGVSFTVHKGEALGIVGESGSGKSVTSMSILQLLASTGRIREGEVLFEGKDLTKATRKEMREIRGGKIAMIFQDPMSSLNPLIRVGKQVEEMISIHQPSLSKEERKKRVLELFRLVRIPEPEKRYQSFRAAGVRKFADQVSPARRMRRVKRAQPARIVQRKTVVMPRRERYVPRSRCLRRLCKITRPALPYLKARRKRFVFRYVQFRIHRADPFPSARHAVQSEMHENSVTEFFKPLDIVKFPFHLPFPA